MRLSNEQNLFIICLFFAIANRMIRKEGEGINLQAPKCKKGIIDDWSLRNKIKLS